MYVNFSKRFTKSLDKASEKIREAFYSRLETFMENKFHPILSNHLLKGEYKGYRSINITGDFRALFQEFENGDIVFFDFFGTHSELYK